MRKKIIAVLLVSCLIVTSMSAAGNVQFKASLSPKLTGMEFSYIGGGNARFDAGLGGDFAAIFAKGMGPYVAFNGQFTSGVYSVVAAFAYQAKLNGTIDLLATVGPQFTFRGNTTTMGISAMGNFDFRITPAMFARIGIGATVDFVEFGTQRPAFFHLVMPLPSFALGWRF